MEDVKSIILRLLSAVFLFVGVGLTNTSAADDQKNIEAINAQWVKAFEQRDFQAIKAIMTSDSLLLAPNAPAAEGPEAVVEVWKSWAGLTNVAVDFAAHRIEVSSSADMAYDYGWYTFAFDTETGRIEDKGKYIVVWKNVNGTWKVAADIFNTDTPLPE